MKIENMTKPYKIDSYSCNMLLCPLTYLVNHKIMQFHHVVFKNILLFCGLFWYDAMPHLMMGFYMLAIQNVISKGWAERMEEGTSLQYKPLTVHRTHACLLCSLFLICIQKLHYSHIIICSSSVWLFVCLLASVVLVVVPSLK